MVFYRLSRFFSSSEDSLAPPPPDEYSPIDFSLIPGASRKSRTGLGFAAAAKVITGDITCKARIKAHIQYKLPYVELDAQLQEAHDREIRELVELCRNEYEDIVEVLVEEWNPTWELDIGIHIYGKPDVRILLASGRIVIGDAKTGAQHNWHRYQNKVALYAACNSSETSSYRPESIVLKYSSDDQLHLESCQSIDDVLTAQELDHLRSTCRDARRDTCPSFAPSSECRYCPFKLGCRPGSIYEQSLFSAPLEVHTSASESLEQLLETAHQEEQQSLGDSLSVCMSEVDALDSSQAHAVDNAVSHALALINQNIDEIQGFSVFLSNEHKGLFLNTLSLLIQGVSGLESIVTSASVPDSIQPELNAPDEEQHLLPEAISMLSHENQYLIDQLHDIVEENSCLSANYDRLLQRKSAAERTFLQNENGLRAQISELRSLMKLRFDYYSKFVEIFDGITRSVDGLRSACPNYDTLLPLEVCARNELIGSSSDALSMFLSVLGHTQNQFEEARVFCSRPLSRSGLVSRLRSSSVIVVRDYGHCQDTPWRVDVQCRHGLDAIDIDYFSDECRSYIFAIEDIADRFISLWRLLADECPSACLPELNDENIAGYQKHNLSFIWDPLGDIRPRFACESPVAFVSRLLDL